MRRAIIDDKAEGQANARIFGNFELGTWAKAREHVTGQGFQGFEGAFEFAITRAKLESVDALVAPKVDDQLVWVPSAGGIGQTEFEGALFFIAFVGGQFRNFPLVAFEFGL